MKKNTTSNEAKEKLYSKEIESLKKKLQYVRMEKQQMTKNGGVDS